MIEEVVLNSKVSVVLCTYNGELYIREQLESIINQTYPVYEIIICDDKSTDNTQSIINKFESRFPKLISTYINSEKLYTVKNFEKAISLTSGDYIFLADQDDIWVNDKVKILLDPFKVDKEALLVFTNAALIDGDGCNIKGDLWSKWGFDEELQSKWKHKEFQIQSLIQNQNKATGATICFRSTLKKDILPMDLPFNVWHDCYICLMASKHDGLRFLNKKLIKYRIHSNQQVGIGGNVQKMNDKMIDFETYRSILKPHFKGYLDIFDDKYLHVDTHKKQNISIKIFKYIYRKLFSNVSN